MGVSMTDRYNALTVVLDRDIRSDDAEWVINAIKMVKGVASVSPHIAEAGDYIAKQRVKQEVFEKIVAIFKDF